MLGKLLKYEFKATGRTFLPLFLALIVLAFVNRLNGFINSGPVAWNTTGKIALAIYVAIMVAIFVMTLIIMIQRFYKNLLTDEGYLMHTLPVKPWQHIVSKLLVSMVWTIASSLVAFFSILIILSNKGDLSLLFREISKIYPQLVAEFGASLFILAFEGILAALITLACGILLVYASIAIGQLVSRYKLLASFGAFIALNIVTEFLVSLTNIDWFARTFTPSNFASMESMMQTVFIFVILVTAVIAAIYFAITNYILSKRLNLE